MYRIGVMGCGVVASYGHLPAIVDTPDLKLAAIFDPDESRVKELGNRYPGVLQFTDAESFIEAPLDAIVIASPAPSHSSNLELAAARGLPVLCEKPLASTEQEANEMIELMKSRNLMLYTGFCYRFSPISMKIREIVQSGAIGNVRALRLMYLWNLDGKYVIHPDGQWGLNERRAERMVEGGPMVDCGVHQVDLARWWLQSEVVRHHGIGVWLEEYEAPDHVYLHMDHACGAHTMVEMSFSYSATARDPLSYFSYELIGTGGVIRYNRDGWFFEMRNGYSTHVLSGGSEKNFHGMYQEFARALRSGEPGDLPTGEDGVIATGIARAATNEAIRNRLQVGHTVIR